MKKNCTKRNMKMSALKTVVVRLTADNTSEFEIDGESFNDEFMEAATRAVEKTKKNRGIIHPVISCWYKNTPDKVQMYNSYWVLINAGCHNKAEVLREKFKMQHNVDLSKEPVASRPKNKNGK